MDAHSSSSVSSLPLEFQEETFESHQLEAWRLAVDTEIKKKFDEEGRANTKSCKIISRQAYDTIIAYKRGEKQPQNFNERKKASQYTYKQEGGEFILERNPVQGRKGKVFGGRIVIPSDRIFDYLYRHHCAAGPLNVHHVGMKRSWSTFARHAYGVDKSVVEIFIRNCPRCASHAPLKAGKRLKVIQSKRTHWRWQMDLIDLQKFSVREFDNAIDALDNTLDSLGEDKTWERYALHEQIFKLRKKRKAALMMGERSVYTFVLNIRDHFARFVLSIPLLDKEMTTIAHWVEFSFCLLGPPAILQSDNGPEFTATHGDNYWHLVQEVCRRYNVHWLAGQPGHSESNGGVEQFNRTYEDGLAKTIPTMPNGTPAYGKWPSKNAEQMGRQNMNISTANRAIPYQLYFGVPPPVNRTILTMEEIRMEEVKMEGLIGEEQSEGLQDNNINNGENNAENKVEWSEEKGDENNTEEGIINEEEDANNINVSEEENRLSEENDEKEIKEKADEEKSDDREEYRRRAAIQHEINGRMLQKRYSRSNLLFHVGEPCAILLRENSQSKLDHKCCPGIVVRVGAHSQLYSVLTNHLDKLYIISDKLDADSLAKIPITSLPGILHEQLPFITAGTFSAASHYKVSLKEFSDMKGAGRMKCGCKKRINGRVVCGTQCKCRSNGILCNSACHNSIVCGNKHEVDQ